MSIPVSFFLGWLGTELSSERDDAKFAQMEVRALTGIDSENATVH